MNTSPVKEIRSNSEEEELEISHPESYITDCKLEGEERRLRFIRHDPDNTAFTVELYRDGDQLTGYSVNPKRSKAPNIEKSVLENLLDMMDEGYMKKDKHYETLKVFYKKMK